MSPRPLVDTPAHTRVAAAPRPMAAVERVRFRGLMQSPLRASLVRHFHTRPDTTFEIHDLMQAFGRLRVDLENCLSDLVAAGVVSALTGVRPRYVAATPSDQLTGQLLRDFLEGDAATTTEDQSPALARWRDLIGRDEKMLLVLESIRTVSKGDISVLILGATGVGKEGVARVIHELGRRRTRTFQAVSCAALPDSLFESELFGYEKGAFTGAHERKPGRIELANGGTLFLDEIGDLSAVSQAKLLRVLEERRVERLGGRDSIEVDFRLLSATNRPLDVLVSEGRFREDLFYRINAFTIRVPSLKERPTDVPILAARFLTAACVGQGLPPDAKRFTPAALDRLSRYSWPGNIREMVALVSRAALSARNPVVDEHDIEFFDPSGRAAAEAATHPLSLREVERIHILRVLETTGWNKKMAARLLEIGRETLYRKIRTYGLVPGSRAAAAADTMRTAV